MNETRPEPEARPPRRPHDSDDAAAARQRARDRAGEDPLPSRSGPAKGGDAAH